MKPTSHTESAATNSSTDFSYMNSWQPNEQNEPDDVAATSRASVLFFIDEMNCAQCIWHLEKLPAMHAAISHVDVNFGTSTVKVTFDYKRLKISDVAGMIRTIGYYPRLIDEKDDLASLHLRERRSALLRIGISAALAGQIMIMAVAVYAGATAEFERLFSWISFFLAVPAVTYCAWPFYRKSYVQAINTSITIDLPIAIAIGLGFGFSCLRLWQGSDDIYFDSIVVLVFLLLSARFMLDQVQKGIFRSSHLRSFYQPTTVVRVRDNPFRREKVESRFLHQGDVIELSPGDICPVDGVLIDDRGYFDNSVITGEYRPVSIKVNQSVYAGAKNMHQSVRIHATQIGDATRLGQIIAAVHENLQDKSRTLDTSGTLARIFTVAILAGGLATFIGFSFVDLETAFSRTLSLVIIACPCALALATPLTISMSLARLARRGILVKNLALYEKLPNAEIFFFDKTGTLTEGEFKVLQLTEHMPKAPAYLLAIESQSTHPIAVAICRHLRKEFTPQILPEVTDFQVIPAGGVRAQIENHSVRVVPAQQETQQNGLCSIVEMYIDDQKAATVSLGDKPRARSFDMIKALNHAMKKTFIISGDQQVPVQYLANKLQVSGSFSRQSPEAKGAVIQNHAHAVMIGDGVNDAIALSTADIGIALHGNIETSLQASDVFITEGNIENVSHLYFATLKTRNTVRNTLTFSAIYNLTGVTLAVAGYINPLVAAIVMPASSLIVITMAIMGVRRV